jgi:methylated-DNA-protein-cysteine methyltransferase-like protein
LNERYRKFYEVIRLVPPGKVATYGQIAHLAGYRGAARQVGYALFASVELELPWQRIINAQGKISLPEPEAREQKALLESEGVVFKPCGSVSLARYRWEPE